MIAAKFCQKRAFESAFVVSIVLLLGSGFCQFIHKMIDCGSESGEDLAETS